MDGLLMILNQCSYTNTCDLFLINYTYTRIYLLQAKLFLEDIEKQLYLNSLRQILRKTSEFDVLLLFTPVAPQRTIYFRSIDL